MDSILVTGGAGYIGSHACKALAASGFQPVTFDNLGRGHRDAVRFGPLVEGDLIDPAALADAIAKYRPTAVLHFAAMTYVGESVIDPAAYYRNNVVGSLNLLDAMRRSGVDRLVFSSTAAVYGDPTVLPLTESQPVKPINPYGATKAAIERMMADYATAYGLRFVALRYFNAAGADPDGELGENHDPETHLIPRALDAVLGSSPPMTIHGHDYATPDGTCIRDYVHVVDLAAAHLAALTQLSHRPVCTAYNLGSGTGYSIGAVLSAIARVTGRSVPTESGPRRAGDPPRLVADAGRAMAELAWRPRYTELDTIIEHAWAWQQRLRARR